VIGSRRGQHGEWFSSNCEKTNITFKKLGGRGRQRFIIYAGKGGSTRKRRNRKVENKLRRKKVRGCTSKKPNGDRAAKKLRKREVGGGWRWLKVRGGGAGREKEKG